MLVEAVSYFPHLLLLFDPFFLFFGSHSLFVGRSLFFLVFLDDELLVIVILGSESAYLLLLTTQIK